MKMFKFMLCALALSPIAGYAENSKSIEFNLTHRVACPSSGSIAENSAEKMNLILEMDGSAHGEIAHLLEIKACDLIFWLNVEIHKDTDAGVFEIEVSQTLSKDGANGFDGGELFCETPDVSKIPSCGIRHMPTTDPFKSFIQTSFFISGAN